MELPQEIPPILHATDFRTFARFALATCISFPYPSHRGHRCRRERYWFCVAGAVGRDDATFQPYHHRVCPFQNTPAYLYPNQHLAYLGFLHQTNETAYEVLRYQTDGRSAATHRRSSTCGAVPHIKQSEPALLVLHIFSIRRRPCSL